MAPVFQTYALKDLSAVQIVKVENLEEMADWLEANLPAGYTVNRSIISYGTLLYGNGSTVNVMLQVGHCLAIDANDKIFKIDSELVTAFYDLVP